MCFINIDYITKAQRRDTRIEKLILKATDSFIRKKYNHNIYMSYILRTNVVQWLVSHIAKKLFQWI